MDTTAIRELLEAVAAGDRHPDDAVAQLRRLPFADLGFARVDHHRRVRQGLGEVVYAPGKTPDQCVAIVGELLSGSGGPVLVSRVSDDQAAALEAAHPGGERFDATVVWRPAEPRSERVLVAAAGTSDLRVATEAAVTLAAHGVAARRLTDVGVAGLHRLLVDLDEVTAADAVIVIAGMEGALASVVGGLTEAPVVAVPTSVGYGAGLEGVTALLAMHASCASGVTVVGIDNGFGAAMAVLRLLQVMDRETRSADSTTVEPR